MIISITLAMLMHGTSGEAVTKINLIQTVSGHQAVIVGTYRTEAECETAAENIMQSYVDIQRPSLERIKLTCTG